jgi:hypothetical protein
MPILLPYRLTRYTLRCWELPLNICYHQESHLMNSCFFVSLPTNVFKLLLSCSCKNGEYLMFLYKQYFKLRLGKGIISFQNSVFKEKPQFPPESRINSSPRHPYLKVIVLNLMYSLSNIHDNSLNREAGSKSFRGFKPVQCRESPFPR